MREQTAKIVQKERVNIPRDWTCNATTADSIRSENREERRDITFRELNQSLSPVFEGNELMSSKLTLNL